MRSYIVIYEDKGENVKALEGIRSYRDPSTMELIEMTEEFMEEIFEHGKDYVIYIKNRE